MSWYDNVFLGSPEPITEEEEYIAIKAKELSEDLSYLIKQDWFIECINWEMVYNYLLKQLIKEAQEAKIESQIAEWEDKQWSKYND